MTRADLDSNGMESKRLRVERSNSSRRLSSRSFSSWAIPYVNLYHNGAEYFAKDWFSAVPIAMKALSRFDFLGYVNRVYDRQDRIAFQRVYDRRAPLRATIKNPGTA